jgi:hypothetical protein
MVKTRMGFYASLWIVLLFAVSIPLNTAAQKTPAKDGPGTTSGKAKKPVTAEQQTFHEDWGSIKLDSSRLLSDPPVLGERDDLPDSKYIRERFQLFWRPRDPLDLYVIVPKGVKKPPVILYLYSFPQDTKRFQDDHWCTGVTSSGYAAVGFVSAFTGHRIEYRNPTQSFISDLQEALATSTHDVQMILNYLASRGDLDMDRVGMYGQGSGGAIAILASAADSRIKALDVLTPWGDWPEWAAKAQIVPKEDRTKYLSPEFLEKVAPLDPLQWLPKVKAQTVRIQDVREDPNMSQASQERMEAAAPPMAEIDQFGDFRALMPMAVGGRLFDWLRAQLQPDAKPQLAADRSQRIHFYPAAMSQSPPGVPGESKP